MNVKRFTARTSREALALVRQAFGEDAVVMSTRPCADGVEVLAMAPESLQQLERVAAAPATPAPRARAAAPPVGTEATSKVGSTRTPRPGSGGGPESAAPPSAGAGGRIAGARTCGALAPTRSICPRLSGAIASTSTPSGQGRVDITTASSPKAWRTSARASRVVRAVNRFTFMRPLR